MSIDPACLKSPPSASKMRRLRAAASKRRMYDAAHRCDELANLTSQVAMLTSTIDTLVALWSSSYIASSLNPDAREYIPETVCEPHAMDAPGLLASVVSQSEGVSKKAHSLEELAPQEVSAEDLSRQSSHGSCHHVDSEEFYKGLLTSMQSGNFATRFAELVGSWEPLEDNSGFAEAAAISNHFLGRDSNTDESENVLEFTASQVHVMIDMVVDRCRIAPGGEQLVDDKVEEVVKPLKAQFQETDGNFYSRAHARRIMELTGRMLGNAVVAL